MEESESSRKEPSVSFPPLKTWTTEVNEEGKKVSPVKSS